MASSLSSGRPTSLAGVDNKPSAIIPAGGEFLDCVRVCAMFDKPYIARYERKAGNVFQLVGTFKDIQSAGVGNGKRSTVTIPFDLIRTLTSEERCGWCGKRGTIVQCNGGCEEIICASSVTQYSEGEFFRCRKSCGADGWLGGRIESQDCEVSKKPAPARTFPSSGGLPGKGSAAALVPGRLRLKS